MNRRDVQTQVERALARVLFSLPPTVQRALAGGRPVVVDGRTLHPEIQLLVAVRALLGGKGITDGPHDSARRRYRRECTAHQGPPVPIGAVTDSTIEGPAGPLRVRHYAPMSASSASSPSSAASPRPLLVFLHGGGFVVGDLDTHDVVCRLLCRHADVHVLAVDYRLAPEAPFPAAVEDALAAFRWARSHASSLGADPARIAVAGDSAGGQLAAVVCQELARSGEAQPAAQLVLYPALCRRRERPSLTLFARGFMLTRADIDAFQHHYTGHTNDADIRQRPLDGLRELIATSALDAGKALLPLAPAVVVTAGFDPLRDEGDEYAALLAEAGGRVTHRCVDDSVHGFANLVGVSSVSRRVVVDVAGDVKAILAHAHDVSASPPLVRRSTEARTS